MEELSQLLATKRYIPEPYQELKIPKKDGGIRSLSLPTVRDKIIQQAVKTIIEPLLEKKFLPVSYAYRPRKGALKAIHRVTHLIVHEKRPWVTLCDIEKYFDSIDHQILFRFLQENILDEDLLTLIRLWVKMGRIDFRGRWHRIRKGIPQGSVISPLLSNLYLHPFDEFMVVKKFGYVRYADDFVILSRSENEAYRAMRDTEWFLRRKLKLRLKTGSQVKPVENGFEFLGIFFIGSKKTITDEKRKSLKQKIVEAVSLSQDGSFQKLKETLEGIARYYAEIIPEEELEELDATVVECLKKRLNEFYQEKVFKSKKEIEKTLSTIEFISSQYRLFSGRYLKGILQACNRKHKSASTKPLKKDPITLKKREYQKIESRGFELVIDRPGLFLGKTRRGVSVKQRGKKLYEARLNTLKHISILSKGVVISTDVISTCLKEGIPIVFHDHLGRPWAKIFQFEGGFLDLGLAQLEAFKNGRALVLAKKFVQGKIRNQINLIKYYAKYRLNKDVDFTEIFHDRLSRMEGIMSELKQLKDSNIEVLRGKLFSIEGRAAACYWELVEKMLNDYVAFEGRVRKGAQDLVNSILNYGYGILYARVWEAINLAGLNPSISYLHASRKGKPSLVFDLIEEFRQQAVDRAVFPLITKGEDVRLDEQNLLTRKTRRKVVEKVLERLNTVEKFRGQELRLIEIIKVQACNLADYLLGKIKTYRPYLGKW